MLYNCVAATSFGMIFSTLFKIIPEPIGLELSDRSIKTVKLKKRGKHFNLVDFSEKVVPENVLKDGVIQSEQKLAKILREAVGSEKTLYVSSSFPEQKTYLRVVQLPAMSKEEIKDAIQWEVEANMPLSLDEIYFDWEIISNSSSKKNHLDILVSVAPKEIVDSYISLFKTAGLRLFSLEPESLALARSVIPEKRNKDAVMIIDIGLTHALFVIHAANSVRFASSTPAISGNVMTQAISKSLKTDAKKAEKLKKEVGLGKKGDKRVSEALTPVVSALRKQAKEYIGFYEAHAGHTHDSKPISTVLLSGGDSLLLCLEENLSSFLNIPVQKAKPGENVFGPEQKIKLSQKDLLKYSTALGLATGGLSPHI